jgi:hypothetical protein
MFEREENAYTLGVQAGLWGYPLARRVEAFPVALGVKAIGLNSFRKFGRLSPAQLRTKTDAWLPEALNRVTSYQLWLAMPRGLMDCRALGEPLDQERRDGYNDHGADYRANDATPVELVRVAYAEQAVEDPEADQRPQQAQSGRGQP